MQVDGKCRWLLHNFLKADTHEEEMVTDDGILYHSLMNIAKKFFIRVIYLDVLTC